MEMNHCDCVTIISELTFAWTYSQSVTAASAVATFDAAQLEEELGLVSKADNAFVNYVLALINLTILCCKCTEKYIRLMKQTGATGTARRWEKAE